MAKELRAGISASPGKVQSVVFEFDPEGIQIRYVEEIDRGEAGEGWLSAAITDIRKNLSARPANVSVVLEHDHVFLHSFPLDTTLSKPDQNEHVNWELSNYLEGFRPQDYITDQHILKARARDQIAEVLTVSVKREYLFKLQEELSAMKLDLRLADIPHFGAQHSFLATHPEKRMKKVLLVGLSGRRLDAGLLSNGRLNGYRYIIVPTPEECIRAFGDLNALFDPEEFVVYGEMATAETIEALREPLGKNLSVLNPFKKFTISPLYREFSQFEGREHHFASALGCVLRKE